MRKILTFDQKPEVDLEQNLSEPGDFFYGNALIPFVSTQKLKSPADLRAV